MNMLLLSRCIKLGGELNRVVRGIQYLRGIPFMFFILSRLLHLKKLQEIMKSQTRPI